MWRHILLAKLQPISLAVLRERFSWVCLLRKDRSAKGIVTPSSQLVHVLRGHGVAQPADDFCKILLDTLCAPFQCSTVLRLQRLCRHVWPPGGCCSSTPQ